MPAGHPHSSHSFSECLGIPELSHHSAWGPVLLSSVSLRASRGQRKGEQEVRQLPKCSGPWVLGGGDGRPLRSYPSCH